MYHPAVRLVLASQSPRRAELLERGGFSFDVVPADVDERPLAGEHPGRHVARVAAEKAAFVARQYPDCIVVAADTVVVVDGRMLGKPTDDADAVRMLRLLAGRAHEVMTAVVVRRRDRVVSAVDRTWVHVAPLSDDAISLYVASGEPRDKAGAYAIQGLARRFVDRIEGSYTNVVGLPMELLTRLLSEIEEEIHSDGSASK